MSRRALRQLVPFLPGLVMLSALACSSSTEAGSPPRVLLDASTQEIRDDSDEIPCEPRAVLEAICQQCHALTPKNGAPFPLVRRSDVLATRDGTPVRELMIQQLEAGRMPLAPVTIAPEARAVLLAWLEAGSPLVTPRECGDPGGDAGSLRSANGEDQ
jgi:uncharacterized membrane protein